MIFIGLDLGQSIDHTALALLECAEPAPLYSGANAASTNKFDGGYSTPSPAAFRFRVIVTHIRQYPLGTNYVLIARDVARKINAIPTGVTLAVDARGPGKPVIDLLSAWPGLRLNRLLAISNTSSTRARRAAPKPGDPEFLERWFVPKEWLFRTLTWLMKTGRFTISDVPQANILKDELRRITTQFTERGYIKHAARVGHDDLVLATAIACWATLSECGELSPLFPDAQAPSKKGYRRDSSPPSSEQQSLRHQRRLS